MLFPLQLLHRLQHFHACILKKVPETSVSGTFLYFHGIFGGFIGIIINLYTFPFNGATNIGRYEAAATILHTLNRICKINQAGKCCSVHGAKAHSLCVDLKPPQGFLFTDFCHSVLSKINDLSLADAVVGMRYASSEILQGAAEVIAYGTAVRFVDSDDFI